MRVFLHDADKNGYPNLALMKLSGWHKSQGNDVEWWDISKRGGVVYSSKVFTYTPEEPALSGYVKRGGSGYGLLNTLPDEIEHCCPDYELYGNNYSMGFLTRGCSRACDWFFVPEKEGGIAAHADIGEFARHKEVVLMDNNVLAHSHGIDQLDKIARIGVKVDFFYILTNFIFIE